MTVRADEAITESVTVRTRPRVVAVIGTRRGAERSVHWAAARAARLDRPLVLVTVFGSEPGGLRTIEQALDCQRWLHHVVRRDRPWVECARQIVHLDKLNVVLHEIVQPGDVVVLALTRPSEARKQLRQAGCPVLAIPPARRP